MPLDPLLESASVAFGAPLPSRQGRPLTPELRRIGAFFGDPDDPTDLNSFIRRQASYALEADQNVDAATRSRGTVGYRPGGGRQINVDGQAITNPRDVEFEIDQQKEALRQSRSRHGYSWEDAAAAIKRRFPDVDPEQHRTAFEQAYREQQTNQAMRGYMAESRRDYPGSSEFWREWLSDRVPIVRSLTGISDNVRVAEAAERIRDATNGDFKVAEARVEDMRMLSRYLVRQELERNRGTLETAGDIASQAPAFMIELALTWGAASAARIAAQKYVSRTVGRSVAGTVAARTAGLAAAAAAETALHPEMVMQNATQRAIPRMQTDAEGNVRIGENRSVAEQIPAGFLDTYIEMFSERSGDILTRYLPRSSLGRTVATYLNVGSGGRSRVGSVMRQVGAHGPLGEMFEERVGDALRGLTGLSVDAEGNRDYGVIQRVFQGRFEEAGKQLAAELIGFSAIPVAANFAQRVANRNGVSGPEAMAQRIAIESRLTDVWRNGGNREAAQAAVREMDLSGPFKSYGEMFANMFPEVRPEEMKGPGAPMRTADGAIIQGQQATPVAEQTQPAVQPAEQPAQPAAQPAPSQAQTLPQEQTPRVDSPMTPEEAGQRLAAEEARIATEGRNAVSGTTQPEAQKAERPARPGPKASQEEKASFKAWQENTFREFLQSGGELNERTLAEVMDWDPKKAEAFWRELRHGEKQEDIAKRMGVQQPTISKWINSLLDEVGSVSARDVGVSERVDDRLQGAGNLARVEGSNAEKVVELPRGEGGEVQALNREMSQKELNIGTPKMAGRNPKLVSYEKLMSAYMNALEAGQVEKANKLAKKIEGLGNVENFTPTPGVNTEPTAANVAAPGSPQINAFNFIKTIGEMFGLDLTIGRVRGGKGAAAQYSSETQTGKVTGMYAGSIAARMHEIAHHVAEQSQLPTSPTTLAMLAGQQAVDGFVDYEGSGGPASAQVLSEGWAEAVRAVMQDQAPGNQNQAEAQKFVRAYFAKQGLQGQLDKAVNLYRAYAGPNVSATERFQRNISPTMQNQQAATGLSSWQQFKNNLGQLWESVRAAVSSKWTAAVKLQQEIDKMRSRSGKAKIDENLSIKSILLQMHDNVQKWYQQILGEGVFYIDQDYMVTFGHKLSWITEGLDIKDADLRVEGTGMWAKLKRAAGIGTDTKASRLDAAISAINIVRAFEHGTALMQSANPAEQKDGVRMINEVGEDQYKQAKDAVAELQTTDQDFYAKATTSHDRLVELFRELQFARYKSGVISKATMDRNLKLHPEYIPRWRIVDEEGRPDSEAFRKGSGRQLISPIAMYEDHVRDTAFLIARQYGMHEVYTAGGTFDMAKRGPGEPLRAVPGQWTEVDKETIERVTDLEARMDLMGIPKIWQGAVLQQLGPETIEMLSPEKFTEGKQNIITFRVNGEKVGIEVHDRALYEMLSGTQLNSTLGKVVKWFAGIKPLRFLRNTLVKGATRFNWDFPIRNPQMDFWTAIQTEGLNAKTVGMMVTGLAKATKAEGQKLIGVDVTDPYAALYYELNDESLRKFGYFESPKGTKALETVRGEATNKPWIVRVAHTVDGFFNLLHSGEHALRIAAMERELEKMGYTAAQIGLAKMAMPNQSPIPIKAMLQANAAAIGITGPAQNFRDTGYLTEELSKVDPFLTPHIAGLTKEAGNIKAAISELQQGKFGKAFWGVAGMFGAYLGLELFHWLLFRKKEWYNELPQHLRYNWWIIHQFKDGSTFGIPKPQGMLRMFGGWFTESLRASGGDNARPDLAAMQMFDASVPNLIPVVAREGFDLARNRDFRGAPIVPMRDMNSMNSGERFINHQLPYVMEQWSGGMIRVSRWNRIPILSAFQSSRSDPNLSVTDFFQNMAELDMMHNRANRLNVPFELEAVRSLYHREAQTMRQLSAEMRGEYRTSTGRIIRIDRPTPERMHEIRQIQIRIAQSINEAYQRARQ